MCNEDWPVRFDLDPNCEFAKVKSPSNEVKIGFMGPIIGSDSNEDISRSMGPLEAFDSHGNLDSILHTDDNEQIDGKSQNICGFGRMLICENKRFTVDGYTLGTILGKIIASSVENDLFLLLPALF